MQPTEPAANAPAKRFVFLAPRFHSNQADLVRKLQEEGHSVDFLVMGATKSEDHSRLKPRVLSPTRLGEWINRRRNPSGDPARRASLAIPSPFEVWRHLKEIRPQVAVLRGFLEPYLLIALPWLLLHGCRIIVYTQGPRYRNRIPLKLRAFWFLAFSILRLRWFTTVERNLAGCPEGGVCHAKMRFIPFFKYPDPGARNRVYATPPRFLAIGKYNRRKNLGTLLEAFADLPADCRATLTIVGENTRPEHAEVFAQLSDHIARAGLAGRVSLLQNLPFAQVQAMYAQFDVFVMPSFAEPASVSQVEAMAHGLAIICNRDNGTAHYVQDRVSGFITGGDKDSLRAAMSAYLESPGLSASHGQAGLARLSGPYSVETGYRQLLQLSNP